MMKQNPLKEWSSVIIFFLILSVVPLFVKNNYLLSVIVQVFMFAAMGSAWNIIGGYGRQISWAHASFFAIGAYTGMLAFKYLRLSPWVSIPIGMILAMIFALIMGLPSFRLKGTYFSLATIACGQIVRELLVYFSKFTGGNNGVVISSKYKGLAVMRWDSEVPYYYIFLIILVIVISIIITIERTKLGYFLKAIREDQEAAESLGIRSGRVKMYALLISAALMAGIGIFYAFKMAFIDPTMVGSFDLAVKIGVIAIVGGTGTVWGPIVGAMIIIPLMEACNAFLPPTWNGASLALYGLILMLIVLFKPEGVWSVIVDIKGKIDDKFSKKDLASKKESLQKVRWI